MQFLYDAALRTVILHSPDDVYPGPFTYKRFWFRDAAFILHAMLCAGLSGRAAQAIERFFPRQTAGGYFRSQEGEWDANGEVLWILRRFCELTGQTPPSQWVRPITPGRTLDHQKAAARRPGLSPRGPAAGRVQRRAPGAERLLLLGRLLVGRGPEVRGGHAGGAR